MTGTSTSRTCLFCPDPTTSRDLHDRPVRRCSGCGTMWTPADARPAPDYGAGYYEGGGYDDYFLDAPRRYEAGRRLAWLNSVAAVGSLWEIGSAGGYFIEAARGAGIDAIGADVSATAVAHAREVLGVDVRHGDFVTTGPGHAVDAVCAFHVLEHVDDPRQLLTAARRALVPGGLLLLEVPNAESPAATASPDWPGWQPQYHNWHFGPDSLSRLLLSSGFALMDMTTVSFREYMPLRYRMRHAHGQWLADLRNTGTPRRRHPSKGELLRAVARATGTDQ